MLVLQKISGIPGTHRIERRNRDRPGEDTHRHGVACAIYSHRGSLIPGTDELLQAFYYGRFVRDFSKLAGPLTL